MSGINKVILVGNVGRDPESRSTAGGMTVVNLTLATSRKQKDKGEQTEWHRVVMFGKLADITAQYVRKGSKIYVEGRLQTRKWQDKQGQDRWTTEIVGDEMQMLDSKQAQPAPQQQATADFDDDVPF